jgi:hypothetical protein
MKRANAMCFPCFYHFKNLNHAVWDKSNGYIAFILPPGREALLSRQAALLPFFLRWLALAVRNNFRNIYQF